MMPGARPYTILAREIHNYGTSSESTSGYRRDAVEMTMHKEIASLQDEDEWDFEAAVRQRVPDGGRAVVGVGS
jgi:hypothetical protein